MVPTESNPARGADSRIRQNELLKLCKSAGDLCYILRSIVANVCIAGTDCSSHCSFQL